MGINTRGKKLPASVVAQYIGQQKNLKCSICYRTFSYDKNLRKHMNQHQNTFLKLPEANTTDSTSKSIISSKKYSALNGIVSIEFPNDSKCTNDQVLPISVKKTFGVTQTTADKSDNAIETLCGEHLPCKHIQNRNNENIINSTPLLESDKTNKNHMTSTSASHSEVQNTRPKCKSLLCDFCGRSFSNPGNFQQHHMIHTGEKPFNCYYCKCSFFEHTAWKEHLTTHSKNSSTLKQECVQPKNVCSLSDSNTVPHSALPTFHPSVDAKNVLMKLNLDLNDKPVCNKDTNTVNKIEQVRSGRLEQLIEALTKEVSQNSVENAGANKEKSQNDTVPVKNAIKNLMILQTKSALEDGSSSNKELIENTVLSSESYQCHYCPCTFHQDFDLNQHEKIHTKGKQNDFHTNFLINMSPQLELESSNKMKSILSSFKETAQNNSFVKNENKMIPVLSKKKEPILCVEPIKCQPLFFAQQVAQQWSCDICSKQCINESHLLHHKKIHAKRKSNKHQSKHSVHQLKQSSQVVILQEGIPNILATTPASNQTLASNQKTSVFQVENSCRICGKILNHLSSKEKSVYNLLPNILCSACIQANQIKNSYPQTLESSNHSQILQTKIHSTKHKMNQKRQSKKFIKSKFYKSKLRLTKSNSESLSFFCKSCKKKFLNKWTFWLHSQSHSTSKFATTYLKFSIPNRYFFQWRNWLATQDYQIYKCPYCDKTFKSLGRFSIHQRFHKTISFVCGQCKLSFFLKNSLRYHSLICAKDFCPELSASDFAQSNNQSSRQKIEYQSESGTLVIKWECNLCKNHFDEALQLIEHNKSAHSAESETFQQSFCHELCSNSKQAFNHLSLHNSSNIKDTVSHIDKSSNVPSHKDNLTSNNNPSLVCSVCEERFISIEHLKTHMNFHLATSLPVQIKLITKEATAVMNECASNEETLPKNNETSIKEMDHHSGSCSESFKPHKKLQTHFSNPYKCLHCNETFSQNDLYKRHLKTHTLLYQCKVCSECYQSAIDLVQHQKDSNHYLNANSRVVPAKKLPTLYTYECNICHKVVRNLKIHMRIHDPNPDTVYKCHICPKTFLQSGNLKQHLMVHSGERPLQCEFCSKRFIHSSHLKRHRQIHTGERPFQCEYCQKSFAERAKLRMHLRTHTKEKPYTCNYTGCGKSFSLKNVLNAHYLLHTGVRPHSCEFCGQSFTQRCNLIAHRRIHTGEKPYKCKICFRAFCNSGNLKDHTRLHSNEKPFKCEICNKMFKRSDYLTNHLVIHSNKKNLKNRSGSKKGKKQKSLEPREKQPVRIMDSSVAATNKVSNDKNLPSELTPTTYDSRTTENIIKSSTPRVKDSIENSDLEQLMKSFSQETVDQPFELAAGLGLDVCSTVENVIEIYTDQDSTICQKMDKDDASQSVGISTFSPVASANFSGDIPDTSFSCSLCDEKFSTAQTLSNHVSLHLKEKEGETQSNIKKQNETENSFQRFLEDTISIEKKLPEEVSDNIQRAVSEELYSETTERLANQPTSDEQAEISYETLKDLSELMYYLTNHVMGELEFQLIGNGPNLHLNSIQQTLKVCDGEKLAASVTLLEFQTQFKESTSFAISSRFACNLCALDSPSLTMFAEHIRKHFFELGLTSASLETNFECNSLLEDSQKLSEIENADQGLSSENDILSMTENIDSSLHQKKIQLSGFEPKSCVLNVNVSISDSDNTGANDLISQICDPQNVIDSSSNQEAQNTENDINNFCKTLITNNPEKVEKLKTNEISKLVKQVPDSFQDLCNKALGLKDKGSHKKVSTIPIEELFTLEQKDLCQIITSFDSSNEIKAQTSASSHNLNSDTIEICIECKPGQKPFRCGICKKMFKKLKYVKDHIKLHVGKKSLVCEICGKVFQRAFNLKNHYKIHKSKESSEQPVVNLAASTKEFSCTKINNSNPNHLNRTKSYKDIPEEQAKQLYTCNICSKSFQLPVYLKQHMKIHTGNKPYACDHCDMQFAQRVYLTKHKRTHTGEKPYKCGYCDKRFSRSEILTRHTRTHTKEKPYSCLYCSNSFALYNTLKRHIRTHTGQKPFECLVCGQAFTQRGNLSIHMRLHTGERPFKCEHCQAGFNHSSNLKKHLKSCSQNKPFAVH